MSIGFSFYSIECGNLIMHIRAENRHVFYKFSELATDPVPSMIRMYNALKNRESYKWARTYDGLISFETIVDKNTDYVALQIIVNAKEDNEVISSSTPDKDLEFIEQHELQKQQSNFAVSCLKGENAEYEGGSIIARHVFTVDYLLKEFENFFLQLLTSKHYPNNYPCYCAINLRLCKKMDDDLRFYLNTFTEDYPDFIRKNMRLSVADKAPLTDYGRDYFAQYDNMLKTMVVPEGWGEED